MANISEEQERKEFDEIIDLLDKIKDVLICEGSTTNPEFGSMIADEKTAESTYLKAKTFEKVKETKTNESRSMACSSRRASYRANTFLVAEIVNLNR